MGSRIAAISLGLIAGITAGAEVFLAWNTVLAAVGVGGLQLTTIGASLFSRLAWTLAAGIGGFAAVSSITALILGLIVSFRIKARIDRLRHDSKLVGQWGLSDWTAAFRGSAIADQAGSPPTDPAYQLNLERIWLDRLMLVRTLSPLPLLLAAGAASLALLEYLAGGNWAVPLAAGLIGSLLIVVTRYLMRVLLEPAVEAAVRTAMAAIRSHLPARADDGYGAVTGAMLSPARAADVEALAGALREVLTAPLTRIAEVTERLADVTRQAEVARIIQGESGNERDQAIESALTEIRAGIERLLENSGAPGNSEPGVRTEKHNALISEIARSVEGLSGQAGDKPAADSLKNLLREFDRE